MGLGYSHYDTINYGNRYNAFNGALKLDRTILNFTNFNPNFSSGYMPMFSSSYALGTTSSVVGSNSQTVTTGRRRDNATQENTTPKPPELELNDYCLEELKNDEKVNEKKVADKNLSVLGAVGMGALMSSGYLKRAFQTGKTDDVLQSVFKNSDGYAKLMASAPIEMIDAQDKMMKLAIRFNRLSKRGKGSSSLLQEYIRLKGMMSFAVKTGDARRVAQTSAHIDQAMGKGWFKWKGMQKLPNASAIRPQTGNGIKNFGGAFGIAMGLVGAITTFTTERKKWKEAEQYGEEYAKKQKRQGWARVVSNFVSYVAMDGLTRMGLNALLAKGAKVMATKVLAKGASAVLKVAVGAIPFAGPFLSMAVGALSNLAIEKLIVQRMTKSGNDALVEAKINAKTDEEYYLEICQKQQNGEKLSEIEQTVWDNNQEYFAQVVLPQIEQAQLEQAQLEQQQAALVAQQQAAGATKSYQA